MRPPLRVHGRGHKRVHVQREAGRGQRREVYLAEGDGLRGCERVEHGDGVGLQPCFPLAHGHGLCAVRESEGVVRSSVAREADKLTYPRLIWRERGEPIAHSIERLAVARLDCTVVVEDVDESAVVGNVPRLVARAVVGDAANVLCQRDVALGVDAQRIVRAYLIALERNWRGGALVRLELRDRIRQFQRRLHMHGAVRLPVLNVEPYGADGRDALCVRPLRDFVGWR